MKIIMLIYFVFSVFGYSDENDKVARSSFVMQLSIDENNCVEWTIPQSPYIYDEKYIQLYPGETLFLEVDIIDNKITNLRTVNKIININKTIILKFYQRTKADNKKIHDIMILEIQNPFNKNMEYSVDIHLIQNDKWIEKARMPILDGRII